MILDKKNKTPIYLQIYNHYKTQIIEQLLPAQTKLPSIRSFALSHRISKTTIEKAYHQLQIEGFIKSEPKSGYYVLSLIHKPSKSITSNHKSYHFMNYDNLKQPLNSFDITPFKKCLMDTIHYETESLYSPPETKGEYPLRLEIASFLNQYRNTLCNPEQVLIAAGVQNHLLSLATFYKKKRVAYLEPLFDRAQMLFNLLDYTLIPCLDMEEIYKSDADIIYISPSNLYPSGEVLPIADRLNLIDYARKHDCLIIEDDYNYIYRYNAYQIPSIQGLAHGESVVYIGSFSRNLLVSIRLSYMVLPMKLLDLYHQNDQLAQTVSKPEQLAIAKYIKLGYYNAHLKKLSALARKQNEKLSLYLETITLRDGIVVDGLKSNLHILIHCKNMHIFEDITSKAKIMKLYITSFQKPQLTILLPYVGLDETTLKNTLDFLLT